MASQWLVNHLLPSPLNYYDDTTPVHNDRTLLADNFGVDLTRSLPPFCTSDLAHEYRY
jgi:hypothetical protein